MVIDGSDAIEYRFSNPSGNVSVFANSGTFSPSIWNYFVLTHKDFEAKLYLNGEMVSSSENTMLVSSRSLWGSSGDTLGKASWYNGEYFAGSMDDIRFYNRALSASEVSALYALESQPFDQFSPDQVQIVDSNVTGVSSRVRMPIFLKRPTVPSGQWEPMNMANSETAPPPTATHPFRSSMKM